nr:hypothetical protein [Tanacetum cinerariifolium]
GIRANPKKTKALADLQSLRTLKEMQSLSKKLATLNRFLTKKIISVLQHTEKHNQGKQARIPMHPVGRGSFPTNEDAHYGPPFINSALGKRNPIRILGSVGRGRERGPLTGKKGRQCPIQYVSRMLNEAERNYAPMEKLALSFIHVTRRLRRYFEAYSVKVITDQPIKNILNNTTSSGNLAKYTIELRDYNIMFMHRNVVKGQVLADFLSEAPKGVKEELCFRMLEVPSEKDDTESWTLFTDGASSLKGSGQVKVDSKLVACQINESYKAGKDSMIKYLATAKEYAFGFKSFLIKNIPRGMNQKADVLSKLASVTFNHLTKEVLVEVLNERSMEGQNVHTIVEEKGDNWMTPIRRCLEERMWTKDKNEARCLRANIGQYAMKFGVLFKKGYLVPMLRCVGPLQANYVIREVQMGSCGMRPRAVVRKAVRQGYYWPTMHEDAKKELQKCDSRRIHAPVPRLPKTLMTSIMAPWPFYQWFGLPRIIVTENRTQLVKDPFKSSLMEGIKTRLGREKVGWVDELPNVLWAHRTSIKQSNGETPFSLTYGSVAVIPAEIGIPTYRTLMIRERYNEEEMRLNLDLLQREIVFRRNEASRVEDQGKLALKREGPYRVMEAYENGSYKLQTLEDKEEREKFSNVLCKMIHRLDGSLPPVG